MKQPTSILKSSKQLVAFTLAGIKKKLVRKRKRMATDEQNLASVGFDEQKFESVSKVWYCEMYC